MKKCIIVFFLIHVIVSAYSQQQAMDLSLSVNWTNSEMNLKAVDISQKSSLIGEWVGVSNQVVADNDGSGGYHYERIRLFVRIDEYDNTYYVRCKTINDNDGRTQYRSEAIISSIGDQTIEWSHSVTGKQNWYDRDEWVGNERVFYASFSIQCRAEKRGEVVIYHEYMLKTKYGKNENILGYENYEEQDITLYNSQDNW